VHIGSECHGVSADVCCTGPQGPSRIGGGGVRPKYGGEPGAAMAT